MQNGIHGNILKLFKSYLHNRRQRVVLNGSSSDYSNIESGVPQGSVLGPLLFLDFLFSIVENPAASAADMNDDLEFIHQWAHQWKMEFNPDPTKQASEVLFSCKKSSPNHPQLFFNGTVVSKVNDQKHLGLILDPGLSFVKHLNEKMIKAKKNIGLIKHVSRYLPLKTLDQMYKALVRPHLDYCDIIFHEPSKLNQPL